MSNYQIGPFRLDAGHLLLTRNGTPVALGPKVVETLLALVEHPGDVLTKAALMDRIWPDGFVEESNLPQNIHVIRRTFQQHGAANPIETVSRHGYRLVASVQQGVPVSPRASHRVTQRLAAACLGAAFLAGSLLLVAGFSTGQRTNARAALSVNGERLYEIGRYYWNLRTRDGVRKSIGFFEQVVDSDPHNARGYAALADANVAMGDYCYGSHLPEVYFARATEYAKKGLVLDPNSGEAHAALGHVALDRKELDLAQSELQRAISLDPNYAPAHEWLGIALVLQGRSNEGVAHLKVAADLDPLSVATIAWLGSAAYMDGRYSDAVAYSKQALELSPKRVDVLTTIGQAYEARGEITLAIAAYKRYGAVGAYYKPEAAALLARAYARAHRLADARTQLAYARAHTSTVNPADLAAAAAAIGERARSARAPLQHAHPATMYA